MIVVDPDHPAVTAADERAGDAHAPPRGIDLHADRCLESRLGCACPHTELDAFLFGDHLRVHEADRPGVHGREQSLERRDQHRPLRGFFLSSISDFYGLHRTVRERQGEATEAAREIEQRCQSTQQIAAHSRHVDRE